MSDIRNPERFSVNRAGKEAVRSSLYDFQTYAAAGQTQLTFFAVQKGQSGKTAADTNMEAAGALPSPKQFRIESIELYFFPGSPINTVATTATNTAKQADDMYAFATGGFLDLFIGSKSYLTEAPLGRFPASTGIRVDQSMSGTFAAPNMAKGEYAAMTGLIYRVQPEILLEPTQNFAVTLNWPTVVALPSTVAARVGVVMRGILYRNSQ